MNDATFYSPARGVWVWLRGAWRRFRCRPHVPVPDSFGYPRCRCGAFLP